jgi:hypothetical protein
MTLRFMVIVPANEQSEAGVMPSEQDLAAMGKFNEELVQRRHDPVFVQAGRIWPQADSRVKYRQ